MEDFAAIMYLVMGSSTMSFLLGILLGLILKTPRTKYEKEVMDRVMKL